MATGRSQKICHQIYSHGTLPRAALKCGNWFLRTVQSNREWDKHQDQRHFTAQSWRQRHITFAIFYSLEESQEVQCILRKRGFHKSLNTKRLGFGGRLVLEDAYHRMFYLWNSPLNPNTIPFLLIFKLYVLILGFSFFSFFLATQS